MEDTELYEVDTIIIPEEDGSESEYAVIDKFEYEGKLYAVLSPVEGEEVSEEEFLFSYEEEGEDMIVSSIDSDEEFDRVSSYYDSLACDAE